MATVKAGARVSLKNILYLTDISEASEAALPFAVAVAREYQSVVHALHVLTPVPLAYATPESAAAMIEAEEESAKTEVQQLESQLVGLPHEITVERGIGVWPSVEQAIKDHGIDLIILGTHGRTGAQKLLLGSVAEEIFRRSEVPVLTIGPRVRKTEVHKGGKFRRVLLALDFTHESVAAVPYAISIAEENQAHFILLHVMKGTDKAPKKNGAEESVSDVMRNLHELVPADAEVWCRPEPVVRHGNPADEILETAKKLEADLIVMGVRKVAGYLGAATHLEWTTAHNVVAHATCPVLTVRG